MIRLPRRHVLSTTWTASAALLVGFAMIGHAAGGTIVGSNLTLSFEASRVTTPPSDGGTWDPYVPSSGRVFRLGTTPAFPTYQAATGNAGLFLTDTFSFDGNDTATGEPSSSWLEGLSGNPSDADASFELWTKPANLTTGSQILFETGGSGDGSSLTLNNGELRYQVKDGTPIAKVTHTLTDASQYVHVVGVYNRDGDGSKDVISLYVNGQRVASDDSQTALHDWAGSDPSGLGNNQGSVGGTGTGDFDISGYDHYSGEVSVFRFYGRALTDAQVLQNYKAEQEGVAAYRYTAEMPGDDSANFWKAVDDPTPNRDLSLSGVTREPVGTAWGRIYHAYRFDASADSATTDSFVGSTPALYNDYESDDEKTSASVEVWFRPDLGNWSDLGNKQILFETGGGNGLAIGLEPITDGAQLKLQIQNSSNADPAKRGPYDITVDLLDSTAAKLLGDFIQVVAVIDPDDVAGENMRLYVNGEQVAQGAQLVTWWDAANDGAGIGSLGGSNMGGFGSGPMGFNTILGDIALVNLYSEALSDAQVWAAFQATIVPEPGTLVLFGIGALGLMLIGRRRRREQ